MKFSPLANVNESFTPGKVGFVVEDWQETMNKKGEDMIVVTLLCTDCDGVSRQVKDRFSTNEKGLFVLGLFAKAIGAFDKYEQGEIDADDVKGKRGFCKVIFEEFINEKGEERKALKIKQYLTHEAKK